MSEFKDLTITHGDALTLYTIFLPLSSTATSSELGLTMVTGNVICTRGTSVNGMSIYWARPINTTITDTYSYYYTAPTSSTTTNTLTSYTGSTTTISASIGNGGTSGYVYLFGTSNAASTIGKRLYLNSSTQYVSYSVPAGASINVTFHVKGYSYMKVGSTNIYSCTIATNQGTMYVALSESSTPSTSSYLKRTNITTPIYTSNYSSGNSSPVLSYTNSGTSAKTVYAHCYAVQSGIPIYSIKTSSGGSNVTSGTVYMYLQASVTATTTKTTTTAASLHAGTWHGTNGMAYTYSSTKNHFIDIPSIWTSMFGGYGLKFTSSTGLQRTSNSGQSWTTI